MFEGKYGKVLTILLIVAILAIVGLVCYVVFQQVKEGKDKEEKDAIIAEFDRNVANNTTNTNIDEDNDEEETETENNNTEQTESEIDISDIINQFSNSQSSTSSGGGSSYSSNDSKTYYKGFLMVGYIEIPKTGVKLPILETVTKKSLEASVAILYPIDAKLNESPNVVIAGHNYRNSSFFSNNKKLVEGDKIYITDESGRKVEYTVYINFETPAEDTSFYARNSGVREITLTTCTQDSRKRTIVLARAKS